MVESLEINFPELEARHDQFLEYISAQGDKPMLDLVEPYKQYDAEMRKIFAQNPDHPAAKIPNVVPIYTGHEEAVKIRARKLDQESEKEKESFIMPLKDEDRRKDGLPAIVQSLRDFRTNFNVFSESSLVDLNWENVVVAGSAVVTSLLAVPDKHNGSKRALREYYHEKLAPASDVDLFIYGLTEEQAKKKIEQIEQSIRDAILTETTTVRTKNAITIASQYPTRHVQIVLRIYKSISEILTGFDVDCSCAAYDGKQVWASPRALAAYMTQINTIDLTRRSPSYEKRLSKYAHRGFEVYWPNLDRSRIDPTIFERSFGRTEGLARLLILEKLPKSRDRDAYLDQRRAERGRPAINRHPWSRFIRGNIKDRYENEVAEWVNAEDVSDYHTFTIPYGPNFHARKIEKLLYTKDLLLNAEWNKPGNREVNLHRHPAFFGRAEDVFNDCCGYCPKPATIEEEDVAKEEGKVYISGEIGFMKDDPGRQTIGSFHPLTAADWTDMAYVGNTEMLCKAIVDGDSDFVRSWLRQEGNDPNTRDYTGRTPLHLAATNASLEIVQLLIDANARLVARLVDGKTALHLAAMRGSVEIVSALLRRSEANEEEENNKMDARRAARTTANQGTPLDVAMKDANISEQAEEDSDIDMVEDGKDDDDMDATTENSIVKIKSPAANADDKALDGDEDKDDPDYYDINVLAWDTAISPLHLAIAKGHVDVVKTLVQEFGADVLLPIKLLNHDKSARAAILTLVLALQLPIEKAKEMVKLLIELGASLAQADMHQNTALQYAVADRPDVLKTLIESDKTGASRAMNHLSINKHWYRANISSPLMTAIKSKDSLTALRLLTDGAKPEIGFTAYMDAYQMKHDDTHWDSKQNRINFEMNMEQPIINAIRSELPELAKALIEDYGVDPNTLSCNGWNVFHNEYPRRHTTGTSVLDEVREHLQKLRNWRPSTGEDLKRPVAPQDDANYLSEFSEGSYAHWSAYKQLQAEKNLYKEMLESHERRVEESKKPELGLPEKQAAVLDMIQRFEKLEATLLAKGAKTFYELHPQVNKPEKGRDYHSQYHNSDKPKPFEIKLNFQMGNLTDEAQQRYLQLFEAAWKGDLKTAKELTLMPWRNAEGEDQPPLTISIRDNHGLTPFAIAVLHGHFELATAFTEIARAQYVAPDGPKQQRYRLGNNEDDSDADAGGEDIPIYTEIVDQQFTIETIGEVSTQVKCRTKAASPLKWNYPVSDFMGGPLRSSPSSKSGFSYFGPRRQHTMAGKRTNTGSLKAASNHISNLKRAEIGLPQNLIQFALHNDDQDLLNYLLDLGNDLVKADIQQGDDESIRYFSVSDDDYLEAIKLDRPHLLAEIIKRTGAGIPLEQLMKQSGVEIKAKPKYYQGLSVYGEKRKDWAMAGRGQITYQGTEKNYRPGLLEAARHQSLETVEWFLSDAPIRCYETFAKANASDKRIQCLSGVKGGFKALLEMFLTARSNLAIHCCLMGRPMPETLPLLRFLLKAMPDAINSKSQEGITPLQIAFWHYRHEAAKLLIDAGADQTIRDKFGQNIIHALLRRPVSTKKKLETLPLMFDLIDSRLLPSLFLERSSEHPGSLTPLAQRIQRQSPSHHTHDAAVLRVILTYSRGAELSLINGEGNTPLHVTIRENNPSLSQILLDHEPALLLRENATGRTPFEMAEDAAIAAACSDPPPLPGNANFNDHRAKRLELPASWNSDVYVRSAFTFVEEPDRERRSERERVWDLVREVKGNLDEEGAVGKRKLVTLNEANEVARRLAVANRWGSSSAYGRGRYQGGDDDVYGVERDEDGGDGTGSEGGADEVQLWMSLARSHLEDDDETETSTDAPKGVFTSL